MMKKSKILTLMITLLCLLFLFSITKSNALTINIDETLGPNQTLIHISNADGTDLLFATNGYCKELERDITTGTTEYTILPLAPYISGDETFEYTGVSFNIANGWTYNGHASDSRHPNTWETNFDYFYDTNFNIGDKVKNTVITIDRRYLGTSNSYGYGFPDVNYCSSYVQTSWYIPSVIYDGGGTIAGTYVYDALPRTLTPSLTAGVFTEWYSAGWWSIQSSAMLEVNINMPAIGATENVESIHIKFGCALDTFCATAAADYVLSGVYIHNYKTGFDEVLFQQASAYGNIIPPAPHTAVIEGYYDALIYDGDTGNANSYFSNYPNGYGNVKLLFGSAGSAYVIYNTIFSAVYIDYVSVEREGYSDIDEYCDLPLTINGVGSTTNAYTITDTYDITIDDTIGPFIYSDPVGLYYRIGIATFDNFGKQIGIDGDLYYDDVYLCGTYAGQWVLSLTDTQLAPYIDGSGNLKQLWVKYISGFPVISDVLVTSYLTFEQVFKETIVPTNELHSVLNYDTYDTSMYFDKTVVDSSKPIETDLQTVDITGLCTFTPREEFPYGSYSIPVTLLFSSGGSYTILLDVYFDGIVPTVPISYATPTTAEELTDVVFSLENAGDCEYCFLVYQDSSDTYYVEQLDKDIITGDFSLTLKFYTDVYEYWYYMIDEHGNVRTTDSTDITITVSAFAVSLNLSGLLSWIAIIAVMIGMAVVLRESGKGSTRNYLIVLGLGATILVIMSIFGLFPVTLNMLAMNEWIGAVGQQAFVSYLALGIGIAVAVIGGFFVLRYAFKPKT